MNISIDLKVPLNRKPLIGNLIPVMEGDNSESLRKELDDLIQVISTYSIESIYDRNKSFFKNLFSILKKHKNLKHSSIGYLLYSIAFLFQYSIRSSKKYANWYLGSKNNEFNLLVNYILELCNGVIIKYNEQNVKVDNLISFLFLIADPLKNQFKWQWNVFESVVDTNYTTDKIHKTYRRTQLSYNNFTVPIFSFLYNDMHDFISTIPVTSNIIYIIGHHENGQLSIDLKDKSLPIEMNNFVDIIDAQFENKTIILFNCAISNINSKKNYFIYNDKSIDFRSIVPFAFCFAFHSLFSHSIINAFEFSKSISYLFNDASQYFYLYDYKGKNVIK